MTDVKSVVEAAQQLADATDQRVAIYQEKKNGELEYEVLGAVEDFYRILEVLSPRPADIDHLFL